MVDGFGGENHTTPTPVVAGVRRVVTFAALIPLVVLGAVGLLAGGRDSADTESSVFPVGSLEMVSGRAFDLSDLRGTPTVVNFFASWCGPCRAEMPDFQRVSQEFIGDVTFIGINTGETDLAAARQLIADAGVTYATLLGDDGTILQQVGGLAMPTTVFVDEDRNVLKVHSGILTADKLRERIEEYFGY